MLHGERIVCLSSLAWRGRPTSRHHLAREFSRANNVLFVDAPTRASRVGLSQLDAHAQTSWRFEPPPHLPVVNATVSRLTLPLSRRLYERAVLKVVKSLGWRQPISWNCSPLDFSWRIGPLLGASIDVLHLTDAFWEYPGFGPDQRRHLRAAAQSADIVVCTTDGIRDGVLELAAPKRAPEIVGHGVDVGRFSAAIDSPPLDGPVAAAFVGRLDRRLDIELVESLARSGVRVVLVGPSALPAADSARLRAAGCELPGEVPYDELSGWMAGADVGIVPYRLVPSVVASRPLKLLEYLAAGLPVVTTPLPAAVELGAFAVVADRATFVDAVGSVGAAERALEGADRSQIRNGRVARVRRESWETRSQELSAVIEAARSNG